MSLFEKIKGYVKIADVVESFGVQLNANNKGLCPFHKEKTPSFSVKIDDNTWKCFGCGEGGDVIDFVAKLKEIEPIEAAKLLAEQYQINIDIPKPKNTTPKKQKLDIKKYLEQCAENVSQTDYFIRRGITDETVKKYKLGYDPKQKRVTIPYSSKLSYYCARSTVLSHKEPMFMLKPRTEDAGEEPLFAKEQLYVKSGYVFVVESQICALSIMQCEAAAISLCGTNGVGKLIKECKSKKPTATLILCMDNDEPGQKASQELANQLFELNIKFIAYNIAGKFKDPNELLIHNAELLCQNISAAKTAARKKYLTDKDSITAYELQASRLTEPTWLIQEVLPEGLAIICAPSKAGKSWMMLQMSLAICEGKEFLGFNTNKADCLYYALEDSKVRLKDRMNKMLGDKIASRNLHLAIKADPLDSGLLDQIKSEIVQHPNIQLVIIDTLQKVRGKSNRNETTYTSDYREMAAIKEFADKHKICILLVHHLRKMSDDSDVFNMISGSNGIMAACDTIFIIKKKKRGDDDATFSMTGRDIKQSELIIHFDPLKYQWEVIGTAEEEESKRAKRDYENNPVVKTIKKMVESSPLGWKGSATDIIKSIYDVTGEVFAGSSTAVGKAISEYETKLYSDGIDHKTTRTGSKRVHTFFKRQSYMPYIQGNFMENDD